MKNKGGRFRQIFSRWIALTLAVLLMGLAVLNVSAAEWEDITEKDAQGYLQDISGQERFAEVDLVWKDAYNRSDVLESIGKNKWADAQIEDCKMIIEAQLESIENGEIRIPSEEQQALFVEQLKAARDSLTDQEAKDELIAGLNALNDGSEAPIVPEKVDALLETLEELKSALELFPEVMSSYQEYAQAADRLKYIQSQFEKIETDRTGTDGGQEKNIFNEQQTIDAILASYFQASSEERETLTARMRALKADTEAYSVDIAIRAMKASDDTRNELSKELKTLIHKGDSVGKLLGFIGIGVGAVGILMGILAVIFSLNAKKEEESIDLSQLASRSDTETLNNQNRMLRDNLEQLEERIATLQKEIVKEPSPAIPNVDSPPKPGQQKISQQPKMPEQPKHEMDTIRMAKCDLKLEYQSVAPVNSFLKKSDGGEYLLYGDSTVEPKQKAILGKMNQMSGWQGQGLFYLFNVQLDGKEYGENDLSNISGYYIADSVQRRACVEENTSGNFVLKTKGLIRMDRA